MDPHYGPKCLCRATGNGAPVMGCEKVIDQAPMISVSFVQRNPPLTRSGAGLGGILRRGRLLLAHRSHGGCPSQKPGRPGASFAPSARITHQRKLGHIEACLDDRVDLQGDSFAAWKLRYCAMPELALDEVDSGAAFAGRPTASEAPPCGTDKWNDRA